MASPSDEARRRMSEGGRKGGKAKRKSDGWERRKKRRAEAAAALSCAPTADRYALDGILLLLKQVDSQNRTIITLLNRLATETSGLRRALVLSHAAMCKLLPESERWEFADAVDKAFGYSDSSTVKSKPK